MKQPGFNGKYPRVFFVAQLDVIFCVDMLKDICVFFRFLGSEELVDVWSFQ